MRCSPNSTPTNPTPDRLPARGRERLSYVSLTAATRITRPRACAVRGPIRASERRVLRRTHCAASSQVRAGAGWVRGGGSRFLQTDPIPGGSANDYDYCRQDPMNCTDLDGRWPHIHIHWRHVIGKTISTIGTGVGWASTAIPGPQAAFGGIFGTVWQVGGQRIAMDHPSRAARRRLFNQLMYGLALDGLSAVLGRAGSKVFVHAVGSFANTSSGTASMRRHRHLYRDPRRFAAY
jgi:hypothetical protein